jgi:hypothetical protein
MSSVLTEGSAIKCGHQGTVQPAASQQKLKVGGKAVLVLGDLVGSSVSSCSTPTVVPPPPPPTQPCRKTAAMSSGTSTKLKVDGKAVLLDTASGMTNGLDPGPGTWKVESAAQTKLAAS